jgi:hypothetical protein
MWTVLTRNISRACKAVKLTKKHSAPYLLTSSASNAVTDKCVYSEFLAHFLIPRLVCLSVSVSLSSMQTNSTSCSGIQNQNVCRYSELIIAYLCINFVCLFRWGICHATRICTEVETEKAKTYIRALHGTRT